MAAILPQTILMGKERASLLAHRALVARFQNTQFLVGWYTIFEQFCFINKGG